MASTLMASGEAHEQVAPELCRTLNGHPPSTSVSDLASGALSSAGNPQTKMDGELDGNEAVFTPTQVSTAATSFITHYDGNSDAASTFLSSPPSSPIHQTFDATDAVAYITRSVSSRTILADAKSVSPCYSTCFINIGFILSIY